MPSWTPEQKAAIDLDDSNIIVSAGAGSGKTLVLTTRVIRKLESGIPINKLLVLTFTNDAAKEMKARIRKAIKKVPSLKKELDLLDSSYITTFDSYSLSLVKKYNYLLNVSKDIKIIDSSIINIKKKEYLDEIFDYFYSAKDEDFLSLINDFCIKDDTDIKKYILRINSSLEMKYDKTDYLNNYIENYYNDNYISKIINLYLELIYERFDKIKELYRDVLSSETDKNIKKYMDSYEKLINSQNYVEIKQNIKVDHPKYINSKEERDEIKKLIEQLKDLTIYKDELDLKSSYISTEKYIRIIIKIIKTLDNKIAIYKNKNEAYEFVDISKMAIKLVLDYPNIRDEIRNSYNEIMVDEYQDTNDLQEMFITSISNNNVYMVGDIKQSIYRFRNANPDIFKNKYDNYSNNIDGKKIDLVKNFRSRDEVLSDINKIFDILMEDKYGGADYKKSHRMVFGQENYIKNNDLSFSNHLDMFTYSTDELKNFTNAEKEAFIIARDIKEKIKSKYKVIDKETDQFRDIKYEDFCIIVDRTSDFNLYRQIFEYENLPLVTIKDEVLTSSYDILIIKNLISLIIKIKKGEFDKEYKYFMLSILRSYLYSEDDSKIFDLFKENSFRETDLFKKAKNISYKLDELSPHSFIELILKEFNFYEKALTYHDMDKLDVRLSYLLKMAKDLEALGYTPYDLKNYITQMIESDDEIKYKINTDIKGISIITIHRSKGLEYPVCYFPGLYKEFNIKDIKDEILYDKNYGIITEYYDNGVGNLFTKKLAKDKYIEEEISEKIRLFYVALTRAREKMIMVLPEGNSNVPKKEVKSFYELISPIRDMFNIEYKDLKDIITKDYSLFKTKNLEHLNINTKVVEKEVKVNKDVLETNHYSKINNEIKTLEELNNMKYGTDIHYLFEITDLKKKTDIKEINNFLEHDEVKNIKNSKIYKEYEFMYDESNKTYHGIIDLMLVYDDHIDIIDYKLFSIDDNSYDKQLKGYKDYIKKKTDLPINMYLYSINKDVFRRIID